MWRCSSESYYVPTNARTRASTELGESERGMNGKWCSWQNEHDARDLGVKKRYIPGPGRPYKIADRYYRKDTLGTVGFSQLLPFPKPYNLHFGCVEAHMIWRQASFRCAQLWLLRKSIWERQTSRDIVINKLAQNATTLRRPGKLK